MTTALIPAAGEGSRLGADRPKALVELGGKTLISYVLDAVFPVVDVITLVVGPGAEPAFEEEVRRLGWAKPLRLVVQERATGTVDAVRAGLDVLPLDEPCVLVWGDQVGIRRRTVARVADALAKDPPRLVLPLASVKTPYVWYSFDGDRVTVGRTRDGDPSPSVGKSDIGLFGFRADHVRPCLNLSQSGGEPRERDFVYVVPKVAQRRGLELIDVEDPSETLAVNDPADFERARLHLAGTAR